MSRREDDIVHSLTSLWRPTTTILAAGANQAAMAFLTAEGRRKAPDLVVFAENSILLFEAKTRASALFVGGPASDAEILLSLAASRTRQRVFLDRCRRLLGSMSIPSPHDLDLRLGLLAGTAFSDNHLKAAPGLICIETLTDNAPLNVPQGASSIPVCCPLS
jgi:hypothetical protein